MADGNHPQEWTDLLPKEAARWVREGLISEEQRGRIVGLYPAQPGASRDRTVLILSILGSVLVGAGVILFFASNWQRIGVGIKVASIIVAIVGTYATGYHLQFRRGDFPRLGQALILLGGLSYGAGIWLISLIYHMDGHFPTAFFLWGAGLIPAAWATSSYLMLYLATILMGVWTIAEEAAFSTYNYFFPVVLLMGVLPLARRLRSALAEAGILAGLSIWFGVNFAQFAMDGFSRGAQPLGVARVMLLFGAAVFALGLARLGDFRAYLGIGAVLVLGGLYAFTFHYSGPWTLGHETTAVVPGIFVVPGFFGSAIVLFLIVTALGAWRYWREGGAERPLLLAGLLAVVVSPFIVGALPEVPRMIAFNIVLFGGTLGLVVLGIHRRSELLVNLGLVIFVVHMLTRYVDLFFKAMDRSLFFILGGILLLGGGWLLERNRRRWLRDAGGDVK